MEGSIAIFDDARGSGEVTYNDVVVTIVIAEGAKVSEMTVENISADDA